MRALAAYIMRGQITAISVVTVCAVLSLLLMPLSWPVSYLSAAGVALVTLVHGPIEGGKTLVGASVLLALLGLVATGAAGLALGFVLTLWLPAWLLASVLYKGHSLALALQTLLVMALASILVIYTVVDNPAGWWVDYLMNEVLPIMEKANIIERGPGFEQSLLATASFITGVLVMMTSWGMMAGLLIARWWQSALYRPGAFAGEFRALRLGMIVTGVTLAVILLSLFGGPLAELALNLLAVLFGILLVQGLAVTHALLAHKKAGHVWVVMLYVLLIFTVPYLLLLLAIVGLFDNWIDFRKRMQAKA